MASSLQLTEKEWDEVVKSYEAIEALLRKALRAIAAQSCSQNCATIARNALMSDGGEAQS